MVHIKSVELSHFKSFGGTVKIPLLPGFTTISGPNGSGKSNILDALLFALGLATSKGMRAERLPDLVNHKYASQRSAVEVSVSVTFDLSDAAELSDAEALLRDTAATTQDLDPPPNASLEGLPVATVTNGNGNGNGKHTHDWTVTRRLRVTKGGNYASTYLMNGEPCTASDLHEQLSRLRIYPEGYNVVLQGDVTRIITMNARERREIIDELAGVAEFDRKINQVRETLAEVREREERCEIIQQELRRSLEKLAADRIKAEKYQKLKAQIQEKQGWEKVLLWRSLQQQHQELQAQIAADTAEGERLEQKLAALTHAIDQGSAQLADLNRRVKALGEDEQLAVAAELATHKAQQEQLTQRRADLQAQQHRHQQAIAQSERDLQRYTTDLQQRRQDQARLDNEVIPALTAARDRAQAHLEDLRQQANAIAAASEAWQQQQTALSKQVNTLQTALNPQRTEQAQLQERHRQLEQTLGEQQQQLAACEQELATNQAELAALNLEDLEAQVQALAHQVSTAAQAKTVALETQQRLLNEQRDKQRRLDKLEARQQASQEAQGTYASQAILSSGLPGLCGLVVHLGQVEPRYQLALETAAGGRLGNIVVEDDGVAAAGIELLKRERAGRATFLPLNKIRAPRAPALGSLPQAPGFIDLALALITYEPRYDAIFAYVFGHTVVFETLAAARPFLGRARIVTLAGELLEASGAMTGGAQTQRSTLRFSGTRTTEPQELRDLRQRLADLEAILSRCEQKLSHSDFQHQTASQQLTQVRQQHREQQLRQQQLFSERDRLAQQQASLQAQIARHREELAIAGDRLAQLEQDIPHREAELQAAQARLQDLETSQASSEWQALQAQVREGEAALQTHNQALHQAETQRLDLENQGLRLQDKRDAAQTQRQTEQAHLAAAAQQLTECEQALGAIAQQITATEAQLTQLSAQLGAAKVQRDQAETQLNQHRDRQQKLSWQRQKLLSTQTERQQQTVELANQLRERQADLPDPLPDIPQLVSPDSDAGEAVTFETYSAQLEQVQRELRNAQRRLEAMEPVNMLALEEHAQTQARLEELTEKLATLAAERTELLLRIENFTTLRCHAFSEAFNAVNENFQSIFATLSQGDGHLDLDNPSDPFAGGLNLIAHPKGKPVQRLSSMSGGEKSLTALSFIFALQRYRPSPFYAFDEVDMFLDGANVERLAKMIKRQAEQAQFIVVSLRRPMIESAQRTIGVTQARGAHTQVLGLKL